MTNRYTIAATCCFVAAGCSSVSPQQPGPGSPSAERPARSTLITVKQTLTLHHDAARSHVVADTAQTKLLYVSDIGTDDVQIYTYPQGAPAGTLTGFKRPQGECVDAAGDVYVANTDASTIVKFTHGGTTPVATLADPEQFPVACAINPRTGDLAVSNLIDTGFSSSSVSIYKKAAGTPTTYQNSRFYESFFLSYDDSGNVFVDGLTYDSGTSVPYAFALAELKKGSGTFSTIPVAATINYPGNVVWSNKNIAIGDQEYGPTEAAVYQVQLGASGGTVTGTTLLEGVCDVPQFFIVKTVLLAPDACKANVAIFGYPAGGAHRRVVNAGLQQPVGAVVSVMPTATPSPTPSPTPTPMPTPTISPTPAPTPTPHRPKT
ncbi:MAG TPA: hypothetical protein VGK84_12880 [Candidatus Tumulicola sp.]